MYKRDLQEHKGYNLKHSKSPIMPPITLVPFVTGLSHPVVKDKRRLLYPRASLVNVHIPTI